MYLRSVGLFVASLTLFLGSSAAAAPLEAYGRLPTLEQVAISPDGQYLAIAATNGEQRTLVIQHIADHQTVMGVRVGDTKLRDVQWAGSNHVLITIAVHAKLETVSDEVMGAGLEHLGVIDINVATRKQSVLMTNVAHALNTVYGAPDIRVVDGKPYALLTGEIFPEGGGEGELGLFRADLDRGVTSLIDTGLPHSTGWVVDAQARPLAQTTYDAPSARWTVRVREGNGWRTVKTLTAPLEKPSIEGLGRDGRSILIYDRVDNAPVLRELAPGANDWTEPFETGRVGPIQDPLTGALLGVAGEEGDAHDYRFYNPQDQLAWRAAAAAYPGQSVRLVGASADHRKLLVYVDSPTDGPAYAIVDLDARSAHWIGAEYTGLAPADIGERREVSFKAADGLELSGYLTLPHGKDPKNLPLVVLAHGGPAARDEPGFDWWAEGLASRGYAVLQVNYRGSAGFGWKFLSAGFGEWGRKMQTDLSDGVRYLAAKGTIDPKRVCIVGASYGGYAALAGATIDHGVYRCAVSIAGPADLRRMVAGQKSGEGSQGVEVERYWTRFMGARDLQDSHLDDISPARLADKADIPILLIHGEEDTTVPYEQSQIMAEALRKAGKPVNFVTLKSEDHYLSRGATRLQMLQMTVDFLEKNDPS